jgi:hypothetical protein
VLLGLDERTVGEQGAALRIDAEHAGCAVQAAGEDEDPGGFIYGAESVILGINRGTLAPEPEQWWRRHEDEHANQRDQPGHVRSRIMADPSPVPAQLAATSSTMTPHASQMLSRPSNTTTSGSTTTKTTKITWIGTCG